MAVIYPHFLRSILAVHEAQQNQVPYPFSDPACLYYEALRAVLHERLALPAVLEKFGLTDYGYRTSRRAFYQCGVAGLMGLNSQQLLEDLTPEVERKVVVLKSARPWIPATKMVMLLKGFGFDVSVSLMRHLYASYGWAQGTTPYESIDFGALNRKVMRLSQLQSVELPREKFFNDQDRLQQLLEVFRTLDSRGITKRYPGSRVSFERHKKDFLSLGLLGLVEQAQRPFRNSKLGFKEEGWLILSKIQKPEKDESYYLKILETKNIHVDTTCLTKIFSRWNVTAFQSQFKGELERLLKPLDEPAVQSKQSMPACVSPLRLDVGYISFLKDLGRQPVPLANAGIFLFLPYLNQLKLLEKISSLVNIDPDRGYSWFSLLLLNLGRILGGISTVSKACRTHELSFPLLAGLVEMPSKDSILNGLASIGENNLLTLRRYLTRAALEHQLIEGKRIAFDFHMRDFTSDDAPLKRIGKAHSPKRQICFPGFRPHLAWDVRTGAPISLEFRNGRARATTTIKRFVCELLHNTLGEQAIEHVYLDSEYTAEHVWQFVVDPHEGLGADLTMCIKQNKRVKQSIQSFLETHPTWLFYDEEHTYSKQTFDLPIRQTSKALHCVLKRHEPTGRFRCFGSTLESLDAKGVLDEYKHRWSIENGIKDLIGNYYFDQVPGIDPHRINLHYFVVTLARFLFEMLAQDYEYAYNADRTKKSIETLRPEFIARVNASIPRVEKDLFLKWEDPYTENQHQALTNLFYTLNQDGREGLPFLGGLRLNFDIGPPRPEKLQNRLTRKGLEF